MTTTVASANRGTGAATGPVIECDGLVKIFKVADLEVVALQGLDLIVDRGEFVAIVGASGSGKSTLLSILGGMEVPSAGRVVVDGHLVVIHDRDRFVEPGAHGALADDRQFRVDVDGPGAGDEKEAGFPVVEVVD